MEQILAQPIESNRRTAIIDILRGWALLGVVIGNYTEYYITGKTAVHANDIITTVLLFIVKYFFTGKSWTLLSVLFGYGFAVVLSNIADKGGKPVIFFLKRMFWLFVLAFINSSFWYGDILKDYAFLGLVLLPFYRSSAKTAFITGVVVLLLTPFIGALVNDFVPYNIEAAMAKILPIYYSYNWLQVFKMNLLGTYYSQIANPQYLISVHLIMLGCMLTGFAAHRINFFNKLTDYKKYLKKMFWISLSLAIVLYVGMPIIIKTYPITLKYFFPRAWSLTCTMLAIMSGICWLYINGKLTRLFQGLQNMGKMTLTNYLTQNIVAALIFINIGLGIFNTQPFWFYILLAVTVYIIQIFVSKWWLSYYDYGPAEWLWRRLTYGKYIPFKKSHKTEHNVYQQV